IIEGYLIRLLQTPPGSLPAPLLQPTASINNVSSDPKFVFGLPSEMYRSSVSLKGPPSPRRNLRTARSAIVTCDGTGVVTAPSVASSPSRSTNPWTSREFVPVDTQAPIVTLSHGEIPGPQ